MFCGPKCKNVKLVVKGEEGKELVACGARMTLAGQRSLQADSLWRLPAPIFVPMAYATFPMSKFMRALNVKA